MSGAVEAGLSVESPTGEWEARFVRPLVRWYGENARVLPWRGDPTPYRVWVSEIILQQTRVGAAIPYFERFVSELPDVRALAGVPEDRLNKLWEGLGYYARARNLKKAAGLLLETYGGQFPRTAAELERLPGIGEYTAGAILSIAFGQAIPAVDANAVRVLARAALYGADVSTLAAKRDFRALAGRIVPGSRPGDFNQALMDLGAGMCRGCGEPLCGGCPVREGCAARRAGCAGSLPAKPPKKERRREERTVFLIVSPLGALLRKRPGEGLLAGLWEYPSIGGTLPKSEVRALLGGRDAEISALAPARHVFTHLEWHMTGWLIRCAAFDPPPGYIWARGGGYAIPSAFKAFTALLDRF